MKTVILFIIFLILSFLTSAGVLYIFGDALLRRDAEIERLKEELHKCQGAEMELLWVP